ncbi:hypothetical protein RB653_002850 [Dictyostelium firmibasis]|uniref:Uncharacterized protein n=1 Tax=Dictyostelium firmibasis TaxID=79012 RepID=A0AAN7TX80_9MYCE
MLSKSLIFTKNSVNSNQRIFNEKSSITSFSLNSFCESISTSTSTSIFTRPNFFNY